MTYKTLVWIVSALAYFLGISFAVWLMSACILNMSIGDLFLDRTEYWRFVSHPMHLTICTVVGTVLLGLLFLVKKMKERHDAALEFIIYIGKDTALSALAKKAQELDEAFAIETQLQDKYKRGLMESAEEYSTLSEQVIYTARMEREFKEFNTVADRAGIPVYTTFRDYMVWKPTVADAPVTA